MLRGIFALLDSRWVSRAGNAKAIISIGTAIVLMATAVIVALVQLFTMVGPVPLFFLGLALVVFGLVVAQKLRGRNPQTEVDNSRLMAAAWGKEQAKLDRRADQIAEDNLDREAKV